MKSQYLVVILLGFVATGVQCGSLFNEEMEIEQPPCCQDENVLSCIKISLNASALGDEELEIETLQESLTFKGMVGDSQTSYHYSNDEADMVITYHANTGGAYGHISLDNGESFVVEYCGSHGHVLKELDVQNFEEDYVENHGNESMRMLNNRQGSLDTTTIVTYSIKVYYTSQFEAATSDVSAFIDQVIAETNQGYMNSLVPIRVKLHCIERATLGESNPGSLLNDFTNMKGTTAALRDSADAAALLVNSYDACGRAWFNTIGNGNTVSVTKKQCALGYYSFGHEIGHNLGLTHNTEVASNSAFSDGHGHLIAAGSASTGYRTILAYNAAGHSTRVNYYSNPGVNYPTTGTPTGVTGVSNNARVLTVNRFNMAAVGDESKNCGETPATTTTTTTTAKPVSCALDNTYRNFQYSYMGTMTQAVCMARCTTIAACVGWVRHTYGWCYLYLAYTSSYSGMSVGPSYESSSCSYDRASCTNPGSILSARGSGRGTISSAGACEQACTSRSTCQFWKWYQNTCDLFEANYRSVSEWTSGPRYC